MEKIEINPIVDLYKQFFEDEEALFNYLRDLCSSKIYYFDKIVLGHVGLCQDLKKELHGPALEFFQDDSIQHKGFLWPRSYKKTSSLTIGGSLWFYLHNPEERMLFAFETARKSESKLLLVEEIVERNELLWNLYPQFKLPSWWSRKKRWSSRAMELPREGIHAEATIETVGVGGAAQAPHYTRIFGDDLIGKKAKESMDVMMKTIHWIEALDSLLVDRTRNHIYLIGTRYAPFDAYSHFGAGQKGEFKYKWHIITAMKDGKSTWEELFPTQHWLDMQKTPEGLLEFMCQYQNDPRQSGLLEFDPSWLCYYRLREDDKGIYAEILDDKRQTIEKIYLHDCYNVGFVDPAYAEKGEKRTARTAIVIAGIHESGKKIIWETWAKQENNPKNIVDKIFQLHAKWYPNIWAIETYAAQVFLEKTLIEERSRRGKWIPYKKLPKEMLKGAKEIRIRRLSDPFSRREYYIRDDMIEFKIEFCDFPLGRTKDLLDCVAWIDKYMFRERKLDERYKIQERKLYQKYLESLQR